jgi:hypothetical protein
MLKMIWIIDFLDFIFAEENGNINCNNDSDFKI